MSVFNVVVVPNRVAIVYRFMQVYPDGLSATDAQLLLSPPNFGSDGEEDESGSGTPLVVDVLREVEALGLLEEHDGKLRVPADLRSMSDHGLLLYLERTVLRDTEKDKKGNERPAVFPRALAWFLTRSPAEPLVWGKAPGALVTEDCGSDVNAFDLSNNARFNNFVYWARYLGYTWRMAGRSTQVVPDPAAAIDRHLRAILTPGVETPIHEAMAALAHVCPVLEGGQIRSEVEGLMPLQRRRSDNRLSHSTSLALSRLQRRNAVELIRHADANALLLDTWSIPEPCSHIILRA